ncbi:hypothetical protein BON30_37985 [Cystobacter ferrugineus]|uniref:Uncharacterized protein n=1 Tax=Cystobacter ferrugineus TaxID=83449 RepID=A0A1L9AZB4_9BACT|nr:hypothetical protein BON30_37985 [Cystobacter ferrugineus]
MAGVDLLHCESLGDYLTPAHPAYHACQSPAFLRSAHGIHCHQATRALVGPPGVRADPASGRQGALSGRGPWDGRGTGAGHAR